jgi:hypothetical protein
VCAPHNDGGAAVKYSIYNVMALATFAVLASWAMSPSVYAVETAASDQKDGMTVAPLTDLNKDTAKERAERPSSDVSDGRIASEISTDVEHPMGVPDSESSIVMPDRRPLCGPWKNAINHVYCAPGYDVY